MSNEVIIRLITIGSSIFVALITITAVMTYYNISKNTISQIGVTDLADNYNENIKQVLYNPEITGAELKNILQYFKDDNTINIIVDRFYYLDNKTNEVKVEILSLEEGQNFNQNNSLKYKNFIQNGLYDQKYVAEHLKNDKYELCIKYVLQEK